MLFLKHHLRILPAVVLMFFPAVGSVAAAGTEPPPIFQKYCFTCHGKAAAAGINIQELLARPTIGDSFQRWQKVATVLDQKWMPPAKMPQPSDADRQAAANWIRSRLNDYARAHEGDPGRVTVRRLTSAEYEYTIQDLTGVDLKVDVAADAVGGEGFANFGDVQFMQDANLERYLEAAKNVADHAVIGVGPLGFYEDPGKSGLELSAVHRIQQIYQAHGFRSVAGEGGLPYGLDRYGQVFYVAWRYRNRDALGDGKLTLEEIAKREGVAPKFAAHVWRVLHEQSPSFPLSEVLARWNKLPAATNADREAVAADARAGAKRVQEFVINWPRELFAAGAPAAGGLGDERALVVTETNLQAAGQHKFRFNLRGRGEKTAQAYLSAMAVNPNAKDKGIVIWRNPTIRIRRENEKFGEPQPLKALLREETAKRLAFGTSPDGSMLQPGDFATAAGTTAFLDVPPPPDSVSVELQVEAQIAGLQAGDAVLRCTISDRAEASAGRPVTVLLARPDSSGFQSWKAGVLEFASKLPQNSHGEPTPSDKDPIPAPFDNTYNQPERDHYHTKLKYYRLDRFFVENMVDEATRKKLDEAWDDLFSSFDYHNEFWRFVATKYKLAAKKDIGELTVAEIEAMPPEPRGYVKMLRKEYDAVQTALMAARPGQLEACVAFAGKAWRRPLSGAEKGALRRFYAKLRESGKLDHDKAIRSVLARVLVAPSFLYRFEQAAERTLTDWELASRMSYFLWSSVPDAELRRAAAAGELRQPRHLERQVKRMLADPKARRLSAEFFGQWLGFYRFDDYRGVDKTRYPEFTNEVKAAMYDEAVSFFEHVIRNDRPVSEIFFGDYTFLNQALAKHYGVDREIKSGDQPEMVTGASAFHRGGLFRLGAVLTATSAPLRTSPVKRGDWVLRRVLGTPTPRMTNPSAA